MPKYINNTISSTQSAIKITYFIISDYSPYNQNNKKCTQMLLNPTYKLTIP